MKKGARIMVSSTDSDLSEDQNVAVLDISEEDDEGDDNEHLYSKANR